MELLWSSDQANCCYKNVHWSPDGTCVLAGLDDGRVELYEAAVDADNQFVLRKVFDVREPEIVYDYCWNPTMSSVDPSSCFFATTGRDQPIHIWDAFTGSFKSSLSGKTDGDELHPCLSIKMNRDGQTLYGGVKDGVFIFDIEREDCRFWNMHDKHGGDFWGLVSTIACQPGPDQGDLIAVGSYSGMVAVFDQRSKTHLLTMSSHDRGVSVVKFSPCGMFLWSGGRCVGDILCWDIRYAQQPLHRLSREQYNNQRIDFDLDRSGRFVVAGDQNGRVVAYDVLEAPILPSEDATPEYWKTQVGPGDCCNGISLHPTAQFAVTSSGMRHFALDDESLPEPPVDYCLRLWKIELDVERTAQSTSASLNNDLQ